MPAITVVKQTVWMTSDGRAFDTQAAAIKHQKTLTLAAIVNPATFGIPPRTAEAIVAALISSPSISIILTRD